MGRNRQTQSVTLRTPLTPLTQAQGLSQTLTIFKTQCPLASRPTLTRPAQLPLQVRIKVCVCVEV